MANMDPKQLILRLATLLNEEGGSDIILNANANPAVRIQGKVRSVEKIFLSAQDTQDIAKSLMGEHQWRLFSQTNDVYFMLELPGLFFLRSVAYRHRGEIGLVLRLLPLKPPTFTQLNLPDIFKVIALEKQDLVLFSGAAGVGKSHSLAAIINYRNKILPEHIVTLEDPVEFIYSNQQAIVTQREVGVDCDDIESTLKSIARQSPDALMLSEIRDAAVMRQALLFSETGNAVFSAIHASTVKHTLERIVNFFPYGQRKQILFELSNNLRFIVNQRLLPSTAHKGRVVALEMMRVTEQIKRLISASQFDDIEDLMAESSLEDGLFSMNDYILHLYEQGDISYEVACKNLDSEHRAKIEKAPHTPPIEEQEKPSKSKENWELEDSTSQADKRDTWGSFRK